MSHRQTLPQRLSQFQTLPLRTSNWLQPGRPWSFCDHINDVSGDRRRQHRPNAATGVDRWGCFSIPLVTLGSVPPVTATLGLRRPETAVRRSPLGRLTAGLNARGLARSLVLRPSLLGQPAAGFASAGRSGSEAARRSEPPRQQGLPVHSGQRRSTPESHSQAGTNRGTRSDPTRCRSSCLQYAAIRMDTSPFLSACVCYRWQGTLRKPAGHTRA